MKNNCKYFIGYCDEFTKPLLLILHKMSGYIKYFKDNDGDKYKNANKELIYWYIDDDKILEKLKNQLD